MASNPGRIPAGGKDSIRVVVHTKNRGGSHLNKKFTVFTNDSKKSKMILTVSGTVKGYVRITPKFVRFKGKAGEALSKTVKVIPYEEFPFSVQKVSALKGKHVRFEFKPLPQKKGPSGYQLIVHNTMTEAGTYNDMITILTDSKVKPKLQIPVSGRIQSPSPQAMKTPSQ